MPSFKNMKQLESYMKKVLKDSMEDVGKEGEKAGKERIDVDVYNAYNPSNSEDGYDRTMELKNSFVYTHPKEINGYITTVLGHNDNLINAYSPNQHMSVLDGSDVSSELPKWINDGTIGYALGQGAWTQPRPYMDNLIKEIEDTQLHKKELKKALKIRGVKTD